MSADSYDSFALGKAAITQLLAACGSFEERPVDSIVDRLHEPDGETWLSQILVDSGLFVDRTCVKVRDLSLPALETIKETHKTKVVEATTRDESLSARVVYYICVAAALVQHGRLISSQPREVWDGVWVTLAEHLPQPAREMLLNAAASSVT